MKKYITLFLIIASVLQLNAQEIRFDIFGNLQYVTRDRQYTASLKKDIFDNLIFTDNNSNEVRVMKRYLESSYGDYSADEGFLIGFFQGFISAYNHSTGYEATYDVDIFGNVKFEDNQNSSLEIGRDIFGNLTYKENGSNVTTIIRRDLLGDLEYRSANQRASLKKGLFNNWRYSDSSGNRFEFSNSSWQLLSELHGNEEDVLLFLIGNFLPN